MPIRIVKDAGAGSSDDTTLTINNFENLVIDGTTPSDVIPDITADEDDAILLTFVGPQMNVSFDYTLAAEASDVVSGKGGTVTTAVDQQIYLIKYLMSKGTSRILDNYTLSVEYSTTASDSGTATAGAASTLTDTGKSWTVDEHIYRLVKLTGGTGSGQIRSILSNTATVLTVEKAWTTNPDATSTYEIYSGFARDGTITRLTCHMTSNEPLTFRGHIDFLVGTVA